MLGICERSLATTISLSVIPYLVEVVVTAFHEDGKPCGCEMACIPVLLTAEPHSSALCVTSTPSPSYSSTTATLHPSILMPPPVTTAPESPSFQKCHTSQLSDSTALISHSLPRGLRTENS